MRRRGRGGADTAARPDVPPGLPVIRKRLALQAFLKGPNPSGIDRRTGSSLWMIGARSPLPLPRRHPNTCGIARLAGSPVSMIATRSPVQAPPRGPGTWGIDRCTGSSLSMIGAHLAGASRGPGIGGLGCGPRSDGINRKMPVGGRQMTRLVVTARRFWAACRRSRCGARSGWLGRTALCDGCGPAMRLRPHYATTPPDQRCSGPGVVKRGCCQIDGAAPARQRSWSISDADPVQWRGCYASRLHRSLPPPFSMERTLAQLTPST